MPNQVAQRSHQVTTGQRSSANDMPALVDSEYPSGISRGFLFANMILCNYFQRMTVLSHDLCSAKDSVLAYIIPWGRNYIAFQ